MHLRSIVGNEILVVDEAAGVREQMPDRHGLRRLRKFRQPLAHGIVELQLARLVKQQDGGGGELLGHRGEAVVSGGRGRRALFEIGEAV